MKFSRTVTIPFVSKQLDVSASFTIRPFQQLEDPQQQSLVDQQQEPLATSTAMGTSSSKEDNTSDDTVTTVASAAAAKLPVVSAAKCPKSPPNAQTNRPPALLSPDLGLLGVFESRNGGMTMISPQFDPNEEDSVLSSNDLQNGATKQAAGSSSASSGGNSQGKKTSDSEDSEGGERRKKTGQRDKSGCDGKDDENGGNDKDKDDSNNGEGSDPNDDGDNDGDNDDDDNDDAAKKPAAAKKPDDTGEHFAYYVPGDKKSEEDSRTKSAKGTKPYHDYEPATTDPRYGNNWFRTKSNGNINDDTFEDALSVVARTIPSIEFDGVLGILVDSCIIAKDKQDRLIKVSNANIVGILFECITEPKINCDKQRMLLVTNLFSQLSFRSMTLQQIIGQNVDAVAVLLRMTWRFDFSQSLTYNVIVAIQNLLHTESEDFGHNGIPIAEPKVARVLKNNHGAVFMVKYLACFSRKQDYSGLYMTLVVIQLLLDREDKHFMLRFVYWPKARKHLNKCYLDKTDYKCNKLAKDIVRHLSRYVVPGRDKRGEPILVLNQDQYHANYGQPCQTDLDDIDNQLKTLTRTINRKGKRSNEYREPPVLPADSDVQGRIRRDPPTTPTMVNGSTDSRKQQRTQSRASSKNKNQQQPARKQPPPAPTNRKQPPRSTKTVPTKRKGDESNASKAPSTKKSRTVAGSRNKKTPSKPATRSATGTPAKGTRSAAQKK